MIPINCDIGERGANHPIDNKLMGLIDIANIACGGHAGDERSIAYYRRLSQENGVVASAHLSYPDKKGFGRVTLDIPVSELQSALDAQLSRMADVTTVKLHGALYNDTCGRSDLALAVAEWLQGRKIITVITQRPSAFSRACEEMGIQVMAEVFAERKYRYISSEKRLALVGRSQPDASIKNVEDAIVHSKSLIRDHKVWATVDRGDGSSTTEMFEVTPDTVCIHSDSEISLELAERLKSEIGAWKI